MNTEKKVPIRTVADVFEKYRGAREFTGIVAEIQKWYYGSVVKADWCATSMSWALGRLGILAVTIGKKQENVFHTANQLEKVGTATKVNKNGALKRGDIVIIQHTSSWHVTARKHITSVYADTNIGTTYVPCIGGNQADQIKVSSYERSKIREVWRPDYSKNRVHEL